MKRISALITVFFIFNLLAIPIYAQPSTANDAAKGQEIEIIVEPSGKSAQPGSWTFLEELEEQLELAAEAAILIEQKTKV